MILLNIIVNKVYNGGILNNFHQNGFIHISILTKNNELDNKINNKLLNLVCADQPFY